MEEESDTEKGKGKKWISWSHCKKIGYTEPKGNFEGKKQEEFKGINRKRQQEMHFLMRHYKEPGKERRVQTKN